jgi:hypothetical protein
MSTCRPEKVIQRVNAMITSHRIISETETASVVVSYSSSTTTTDEGQDDRLRITDNNVFMSRQTRSSVFVSSLASEGTNARRLTSRNTVRCISTT